jgi:hypothetical protein
MRLVYLSAALILSVMGMLNERLYCAEVSDLTGTWRGASICGAGLPACRDEHVVYYLKPVPNKRNVVFIQSDKIVNGEAVTMGSGEWDYDPVDGTLEWKMPQQAWFSGFPATTSQERSSEPTAQSCVT